MPPHVRPISGLAHEQIMSKWQYSKWNCWLHFASWVVHIFTSHGFKQIILLHYSINSYIFPCYVLHSIVFFIFLTFSYGFIIMLKMDIPKNELNRIILKSFRYLKQPSKPLFNNVSTLKLWAAWPCCNREYKWSPEKLHFKSIKCTKNMQVTRNTILISPIDCSVRINHEPDGLSNGDN